MMASVKNTPNHGPLSQNLSAKNNGLGVIMHLHLKTFVSQHFSENLFPEIHLT
jgi:hypothetical protein